MAERSPKERAPVHRWPPVPRAAVHRLFPRTLQGLLLYLLLIVFVPLHLLEGTTYYVRYIERQEEVLGRNLEVARATSVALDAFVKDVQRQELARQTQAQATQPRQLQEQRAQHVLALSHGLRTPLTTIQGQAQLALRIVERAHVDGILRDNVETILAGSRRMSLVLRDLVDLTELESGHPLHLNRVPVEIGPFLADLLRRLTGVLVTERVVIEVQEGLPLVLADPDRLERVVIGLMDNALRYSPPDHPVVVRVTRQEGEVVMSVADQGWGIPPETMAHLFDPYRRKLKVQERPESTGIGLYITRMPAAG